MQELSLHYFLVDCFGIKQEIVFGVTYVLSVQFSCAVVSVFCCGRKVNFVRIPYSHDRFSKISRGNTILVKLELWELVIVFNNNFYSATNLCLRYASAKCGR